MSSHTAKYVENDLTRAIEARMPTDLLPDARVLMMEGDATLCYFMTNLGREDLCRRMNLGVSPGAMERSAGKTWMHITDIVGGLGISVTEALEMALKNVNIAPGRRKSLDMGGR